MVWCCLSVGRLVLRLDDVCGFRVVMLCWMFGLDCCFVSYLLMLFDFVGVFRLVGWCICLVGFAGIMGFVVLLRRSLSACGELCLFILCFLAPCMLGWCVDVEVPL